MTATTAWQQKYLKHFVVGEFPGLQTLENNGQNYKWLKLRWLLKLRAKIQRSFQD